MSREEKIELTLLRYKQNAIDISRARDLIEQFANEKAINESEENPMTFTKEDMIEFSRYSNTTFRPLGTLIEEYLEEWINQNKEI
jgi:uncharacterized membrane protein